MTTNSFPVGATPRIVLERCGGSLEIAAWDERQVSAETDDGDLHWTQSDEALVFSADGDLQLMVPHDAELVLPADIHGDLTLTGVRAAQVGTVHGDAEIQQIAGDAQLRRVHGDLTATKLGSLRVDEHAHGDVTVHTAQNVEIHRVEGDLDVSEVQALIVGDVRGELDVRRVREAVRYGSVGGDLEVHESESAHVAGGSVGGDAEIFGVASVQATDVGGDLGAHNVSGDVRVGSVGGDATATEVAGTVGLGNVGGDLELNTQGAALQIGSVGGDMRLRASFAPGSAMRIHVGGDAEIELPESPNLSLRATVGGEVSGGRLAASGGAFSAVYGEGQAQLELVVGGDLQLRGAGEPRTSSASPGDWSRFGRDMGRAGEKIGRDAERWGEEFGREMERWGEEFGREMERWGEEFGRRMEERFRGWDEGKAGEWSEKAHERAERVRERVEERMREAEGRARRAEERARRHGERAQRVHVRINDREWSFDPERLERLKEQARRAASEGISGAMEAVERAMSGMGLPTPPTPPTPPHAGHPASPPAPPAPPHPGHAPTGPATGDTIKMTAVSAESSVDAAAPQEPAQRTSTPEERRAAILRMVAEGRITPEEGDLLLEALG